MPPKSNIVLKNKLADLDALRVAPESAAGTAMLHLALRDSTNLVVARAAEIAGEWQSEALVADMVSAFARLAVDGVRRDPTCAAKIAIAEALRSMEYADETFWLAGLRLSQPEPSWGPPIDTAAAVRAISALALARTGYTETLLELAPLLNDPELDARVGAIQGLTATFQLGAAALLWFKLLVGDAEPETYYQAFVGLLLLVPDRALPFVAGFLHHDRPGVSETAALALGESRREDALPLLASGLENADDPATRRSILLGMALLRSDAAMTFLIDTIRDGNDFDAQAALKALEIVRHDERLWDRAEQAYAGRSG